MHTRKTWILIAVVVLVAGAATFLAFKQSPAPPTIVISQQGPLPPLPGRFPERYIPAKWTWLRRLSARVFGPMRQITFGIEYSEADESVASLRLENVLGPPLAETNGVAVWLFPKEGALHGIRHSGSITSVSAPRITTADRMQSAIMISSNTIIGMSPRMKKDTVDLWTRLSLGNFHALVRAQVPYDAAFLIVDDRLPDAATNRAEVVIVASEINATGNKVPH